jgi:uncharacterized protein (DUF952 family)
MQSYIYHIVSCDDWNGDKFRAEYQPRQFATEGFIHCSYLHQLSSVADRFFVGQNNLLLLVIDCSKINGKIIDENLEGGLELYPHLYGELPKSAVVEVISFPCNFDGSFALPEQLRVKAENRE